MDKKLEMLNHVPMFSRCRGKALEELGQLADEIDVPAERVLTREGASGGEFFVIVEGTVRIERAGKVVSRLKAGEFFGEISLLDGGPRSATATTDTPARLLVIAHREFHALLADFPDIRQAVYEALAHRVRNLDPAAID